MNTAMSAGLHHRWRARAADLAHVGAAVACSTWQPAPAISRSSWLGERGRAARCWAATSPRRCSTARAPRPRPSDRARCGRASNWPTRWRCPTRTDPFDAATVGFGARNFEDLGRGLAEMARVVRPGGRVVVLEITTPTRPPLSHFYRVWFDRVVPVLGRLAGSGLALGSRAGTRVPAGLGRRGLQLPAQLREALPGTACAGWRDGARGARRRSRICITAGGIVAIHAGTVPSETGMRRGARHSGERTHWRSRWARGHPGPRRREAAPSDGARRAAPRPASPREAGRSAGFTRQRHDHGRRQAPAPAARHARGRVRRRSAGHPRGRGAAGARGRCGRAGALGDARPRRPDRRRALRRGHPTVAAAAGRRVAVATGDLLFSRAFAELARNDDPAQLQALSDASSALAEGELLQREDAYAPTSPSSATSRAAS